MTLYQPLYYSDYSHDAWCERGNEPCPASFVLLAHPLAGVAGGNPSPARTQPVDRAAWLPEDAPETTSFSHQ